MNNSTFDNVKDAPALAAIATDADWASLFSDVRKGASGASSRAPSRRRHQCFVLPHLRDRTFSITDDLPFCDIELPFSYNPRLLHSKTVGYLREHGHVARFEWGTYMLAVAMACGMNIHHVVQHPVARTMNSIKGRVSFFWRGASDAGVPRCTFKVGGTTVVVPLINMYRGLIPAVAEMFETPKIVQQTLVNTNAAVASLSATAMEVQRAVEQNEVRASRIEELTAQKLAAVGEKLDELTQKVDEKLDKFTTSVDTKIGEATGSVRNFFDKALETLPSLTTIIGASATSVVSSVSSLICWLYVMYKADWKSDVVAAGVVSLIATNCGHVFTAASWISDIISGLTTEKPKPEEDGLGESAASVAIGALLSIICHKAVPEKSSFYDFMKNANTVSRGVSGVEGIGKMIVRYFTMIYNAVLEYTTGVPDLTGLNGEDCKTAAEAFAQVDELLNADKAAMTTDQRRVHAENVVMCRRRVFGLMTRIRPSPRAASVMSKLTAINNNLMQLEEAYRSAGYLSSSGSLSQAICVVLSGPAGIGKTSVINTIAPTLHLSEQLYGGGRKTKLNRVPTNDLVYTRASGEEFWSGYHGQFVTLLDDFTARADTAGAPNVAYMDLLTIVNAFGMPLNMASLNDKGCTYFSSPYIIATTNDHTLSRHIPSMTNPSALERRISLWLEVSRNAEGELLFTPTGGALGNREPVQFVEGPGRTRHTVHNNMTVQEVCKTIFAMRVASISTHASLSDTNVNSHVEYIVRDHLGQDFKIDAEGEEDGKAEAAGLCSKDECKIDELCLPCAAAQTTLTALIDACIEAPDDQCYQDQLRKFFTVRNNYDRHANGVLKFFDDVAFMTDVKNRRRAVTAKTKACSRPKSPEEAERCVKAGTVCQCDAVECAGDRVRCKLPKPDAPVTVNVADRLKKYFREKRDEAKVRYDGFILSIKDVVQAVHSFGLSVRYGYEHDVKTDELGNFLSEVGGDDAMSVYLRITDGKGNWVRGYDVAALIGATCAEFKEKSSSLGQSFKKFWEEHIKPWVGQAIFVVVCGVLAAIASYALGYGLGYLAVKLGIMGESEAAPDQQVRAVVQTSSHLSRVNLPWSIGAQSGHDNVPNVGRIILDNTCGLRIGDTNIGSAIYIADGVYVTFAHGLLKHISSPDFAGFCHVWDSGDVYVDKDDIVDVLARASPDSGSIVDIMFYKLSTRVPQGVRDISKHLFSEREKAKVAYSAGRPGAGYLVIRKRGGRRAADMFINITAKRIMTPQKYISSSGAEYTLEKHWTYDAHTLAGDCGSALIVNGKLAGFHTSRGGMSTCYGALVSRELYDEAIAAMATVAHSDEGPVPQRAFVSKFMLSRIAHEPTKALPNLRIHNGEDSILFAVRKYKLDCPKLDAVEIDAAVRAYEHHLLGSPAERSLSKEEAVRSDIYGKVDRATSSGYPFGCPTYYNNIRAITQINSFGGCMPDSSKRYWITAGGDIHPHLKECVDALIARCIRGGRSGALFLDALKDEPRPVGKAARLLSCSPIDLTVATRMYFGEFVASYISHRIDNGSAVGVNCFGQEWGRIALSMSGRYCVAGDFTGWDGSLNAGILDAIGELIFRWYQDDLYQDEHAIVRRALWNDVVRSQHIRRVCVDGAMVTQHDTWDHSLPSGYGLTTIINTLYNNILARAVYERCRPRSVCLSFSDAVSFIAYGDDNVWAVSPAAKDWCTADALTTAYAAFGHTYTNAAKSGANTTFTPTQEVSFLKRRFIPRGGTVACPLEVDAIYETLNWANDNEKYKLGGAFSQKLENMLFEAHLHGEEFYQRFAAGLLARCRTHGVECPQVKPFSQQVDECLERGRLDHVQLKYRDERRDTSAYYWDV